MKNCWKFNVMVENRSCRTDHFYFNNRLTGAWWGLERHTKYHHCWPQFTGSRCGWSPGPWERGGQRGRPGLPSPGLGAGAGWEADVFCPVLSAETETRCRRSFGFTPGCRKVVTSWGEAVARRMGRGGAVVALAFLVSRDVPVSLLETLL